MTRLNTSRELGKLKSDDVAPVAPVSEETEEQRYVTNIVSDAEIETTNSAYEDWLAAQGLLGLKSSLPAEVDSQILTRKTSLNNLHWSLDVIYKFIEVNDFPFVEKEEVEVKLHEIMGLLKSKVEPQVLVIHKIPEDKEKKEEIGEWVENNEGDKGKTGENKNSAKVDKKEEVGVICKTDENKTKGDKGLKTEKTKKEGTVNKVEKSDEDSVICKTDENETKGDNALKKERTQKEETVDKLKRVTKIV